MIDFLGQRYYYDNSTKYHKTATWRDEPVDYLHRAIWRDTYGAIPHGWEIHHRDENPDNNDIGNLKAIPVREHRRLHVEVSRQNGLANWHHTQRRAAFVCQGCGRGYVAVIRHENKWCGKNCRERDRRRRKGL
jgi:hypothetical protein